MLRALLINDFESLHQRFKALFSSIANDNYRKNPIAEDTSNRGRIDLSLRFKLADGQKQVYIFEFKVIGGEVGDGSAMQQLQDKNYAAKYDDGDTRIFLIGIEFSKTARNIVGFNWQQYDVFTD